MPVVVPLIRQKIEHSFPEAQLSQVPIRLSSTDFLPLFERIQQLGGIRLSKQVLKELEETPEKVIFAYPDITKLRVPFRLPPESRTHARTHAHARTHNVTGYAVR
jgi:hypothetical protein